MNLRLVAYVLGWLCLVTVAAMAPALAIAIAGEDTGEIRLRMSAAFGITMLAGAALGAVVSFLTRSHRTDRITPSEGFAVATLGWILVAAIGALPYYLGRSGMSGGADGPGTTPGLALGLADAFFESMSGFTTTGSSVFGTSLAQGGLGLIESMPRALLFWRSMTHWLGGMGIVMLVLAVLPVLRAGGYQLFQAEVPGPTAERIRPRIRETAAILWGVYLLFSVVEAVLLWVGGMGVLDSICHTFGTMATGGFSTKDASIAYYTNAGHPHALYFEIVIAVFMFLAGVNFLLHYHALRGRPQVYLRNGEFRQYVVVLVLATLVLTAFTRAHVFPTIGAALRASVFQTISIATTTGFATADYNVWPGACRAILIVLMFVGGCAGSTGGGLKQVRVAVVLKYIHRELLRLLWPNLVSRVRVGAVTIDERTCANIIALVALWLVVFVAASLGMLALVNPDAGADRTFVTAFSSVAASLNNIGPGLADVGPIANYGWMPASAKTLLAACMLMGRLEIYSVIVVLLPLAWRK